MPDNIKLDMPLLKNESGIYTSPEMIEEKNKKVNNEVFEKYNKRYNKAISAPVPNVKMVYNYILTKAVPPKMEGYTDAGLILNTLEVDIRMAKKLAIMTENVSDEQEVLLVGNHVTKDIVEPGQSVKIDFRRYRTLNDDHTAGVIETSYEIPLYEIDGNEYLLLDARDIIYVIPEEKDEANKE